MSKKYQLPCSKSSCATKESVLNMHTVKNFRAREANLSGPQEQMLLNMDHAHSLSASKGQISMCQKEKRTLHNMGKLRSIDFQGENLHMPQEQTFPNVDHALKVSFSTKQIFTRHKKKKPRNVDNAHGLSISKGRIFICHKQNALKHGASPCPYRTLCAQLLSDSSLKPPARTPPTRSKP